MAAKRHRLARRRKAVGFTQERLAERLGVDPTTVR
jgi:transcriptional regulator with XRE-family HTH domain